MEEVATQLKPIVGKIDYMHDWMIGFWSNGKANMPEGFFQRRMKEDDRLREEDKADKAQIKADLKASNDTIVPLVAYVTRQNVRQELKDEFWRRYGPSIKWAGRGIGLGVLSFMAWFAPHAWAVGKILYNDYMKYHPAVAEQLKSADAGEKPEQSAPQDTSNPSALPSKGIGQ